MGICAIAVAVAACGPTIPAPKTGPIPKEEGVLVPFPPPAAQIDDIVAIPEDPTKVWIDGQWTWNGTEWSWQRGSWTTPPADAYYTHWTTRRREDGELYFIRAGWRRADGSRLDLDLDLTPACSPKASGAP